MGFIATIFTIVFILLAGIIVLIIYKPDIAKDIARDIIGGSAKDILDLPLTIDEIPPLIQLQDFNEDEIKQQIKQQDSSITIINILGYPVRLSEYKCSSDEDCATTYVGSKCNLESGVCYK